MSFTSSQAFTAIRQIQDTPGKNDKTRLVGEFLAQGGEFAHKLLQYTYNPFMTYGVRALPECVTPEAGRQFDETTWAMLDRMIARELTGHAMLAAVAAELGQLEPDSQQLLRMVLLKDLRAGFSESTINKVSPNMIPEFPYMRCSLPKHTVLADWNWQEGVYSQEKADGTFVNINLDPAGVLMTTRAGNALPLAGFCDLIAELEARFEAGKQLHGEILVIKDGQAMARQLGNGMITSVINGGEWEEGCYPVVKLWDAINLSAVTKKGRDTTPYRERLAWIERMLGSAPVGMPLIELIDIRIVHSMAEAFAHYREILAKGGEGTIIKKMDMIWADGTSKDQVKLKLEAPCELKVVGFTQGKGKNAKTFGSLICESACGQVLVRVGTGLTDAMRKAIHLDREGWEGAIISMKFNAIMFSDDIGKKPHSLFLPVFLERRIDKHEADTLERIVDQFDNEMRKVGLLDAA